MAILKMFQTARDEAVVAAVDEEGNVFPQGNILKFTRDGNVIRYRAVDPQLGFQLDLDGRVIWQDDNF